MTLAQAAALGIMLDQLHRERAARRADLETARQRNWTDREPHYVNQLQRIDATIANVLDELAAIAIDA